eukprot:c18845_g1_i1.p1 GENE.c18845_g1_i1~~c18845_g1_i1.p1  ORF type:complete len:231 (+),score=67.36 c18845_g1_i1:5-697(+)
MALSLKQLTLRILIGILGLLSIGHLVSSAVISQNCFVTPCYEGHGLELLWAVNIGRSFRLVVFSLINIACVSYCARGLFGRVPELYKYGSILGLLFTMSIFMFIFMINGSTSSTMIYDLDEYISGDHFIQPTSECLPGDTNSTYCSDIGCHWDTTTRSCVRKMSVNRLVGERFAVISIFSGLLAFFEMFCAVLLFLWRKSLQNINSSLPILTGKTSYQPYTTSNNRQNLD